ncbi:uncharacterized protein LOC144421003 isoform X2 [Styela clava]
MMMLQFSSKIFAICICLISISGISIIEAMNSMNCRHGGGIFSGYDKLPSPGCSTMCNYTFHLRLNTLKLLELNVTKNDEGIKGSCQGQFQIQNLDLYADVDTPRCYILYREDCAEPVELAMKHDCNTFKITDDWTKVYIGQDVYSTEPLSVEYSYTYCTKAPTTPLSATTRKIKHKITSTYQDISSRPSTFTAEATTTPFTSSAPITPNGRLITKAISTPLDISSTTSMVATKETSSVSVTTTGGNTISKLITSSNSPLSLSTTQTTILNEEWTNSKFETNSISDTTAVKDTMSHDITDVVSQVTHALTTTSFSNHTMEGNDENADSRMDTILAIIVPCSIVLLLGVIAVPTLLCLRKRKLQNQNQSIELHRESTTAVGQSALNLAKKPVNVFEQNSLHEVSSEFDSFSDAQGEHPSSGEMVNNVLYGMV